MRASLPEPELLARINSLIQTASDRDLDGDCKDCRVKSIQRLGETDPATGANWTVSFISNCEGGCKEIAWNAIFEIAQNFDVTA